MQAGSAAANRMLGTIEMGMHALLGRICPLAVTKRQTLLFDPIDNGQRLRRSGIPVSGDLHIECATAARGSMDPHKCLPHDALFVRSVPFANAVAIPVGSRRRAACGEVVPK
jgi:hypothetical protein